jgi:vacuolar-type H+-ATPase subunit F/Vma7
MQVAFLGDRYSALGFRLAGADVYMPAPAETTRLLERLSETAALILLTPAIADQADREWLDEALARTRPLLLVVPDAAGRERPPDIGAQMRRILGVESKG